MHSRCYLIITAARNEDAYIEGTIASVIPQTVQPEKWLITSDGSTDRTDSIVQAYASEHDFIRLRRLESGSERTFGSKVRALNSGYGLIKDTPHSYVAVLDADVSFDRTYYEQIIREFERYPRLGIAGGVLLDRHGDTFLPQRTNTEWSVSGPIQMFRRECFEAVGGYVAAESGEDAIAETMARQAGWQVRAFPEIRVRHHRATGTAGAGTIGVPYASGIEAYKLGHHPLFFFTRCAARMTHPPYVLGGLAAAWGYTWSCLRGSKRDIPNSLVRYLRQEQLGRMRRALSGSKPGKDRGDPYDRRASQP